MNFEARHSKERTCSLDAVLPKVVVRGPAPIREPYVAGPQRNN